MLHSCHLIRIYTLCLGVFVPVLKVIIVDKNVSLHCISNNIKCINDIILFIFSLFKYFIVQRAFLFTVIQTRLYKHVSCKLCYRNINIYVCLILELFI